MVVAAALHAVGNPIDAGGVAVTSYGVEPPLAQLTDTSIAPASSASGHKDPMGSTQTSVPPVGVDNVDVSQHISIAGFKLEIVDL